MAHPSARPPATLESLKQIAAGDAAFLHDMIDMFLVQAAEQLAVLHAQCTEGENADWAEAAHALKGSAASVGAEALRRSCARAQEMHRAGRAERAAVYADITKHYEEVRVYLLSVRGAG